MVFPIRTLLLDCLQNRLSDRGIRRVDVLCHVRIRVAATTATCPRTGVTYSDLSRVLETLGARNQISPRKPEDFLS